MSFTTYIMRKILGGKDMEKLGLLVIPCVFLGGCYFIKRYCDMEIAMKDMVISTQDTLIECQKKELEMLKQRKESQEKKS